MSGPLAGDQRNVGYWRPAWFGTRSKQVRFLSFRLRCGMVRLGVPCTGKVRKHRHAGSMAEQLSCKQQVVGSIPTRGSTVRHGAMGLGKASSGTARATRGSSSMAEQQPSKLSMRVRFPSSSLFQDRVATLPMRVSILATLGSLAGPFVKLMLDPGRTQQEVRTEPGEKRSTGPLARIPTHVSITIGPAFGRQSKRPGSAWSGRIRDVMTWSLPMTHSCLGIPQHAYQSGDPAVMPR